MGWGTWIGLENYQTIYIWKILERLVTNFGIYCNINVRTGRRFIVSNFPPTKPEKFTQGRSGCFKKELNIILSTIRDEPTARHEVQTMAAETNSFTQQMYWQPGQKHLQQSWDERIYMQKGCDEKWSAGHKVAAAYVDVFTKVIVEESVTLVKPHYIGVVHQGKHQQ